ncbi:MAG: MBL fold metallo-hydrolase [Ignavibacteriales bacterium]|nr:MBL fold metallo-hydrolase [Ignavibacteriales bacterium]
MKIKTMVFNPFSSNTYLIWDEKSKDAIIIDPGCFNEEEEKELNDILEKEKLNVKYLFNTHCHIDHIFGNVFILEKFTPEFYIGKEDEFLLDGAIEQAERFGMKIKLIKYEKKYFSENKIIKFGEMQIIPIHTPGHSPGSFSFYFKNENICFTGDVLFLESIGRTDLWGGNYDILRNSIVEKLFKLPDDTQICPGHSEMTTIGYEKKYNSFV